MKRMITLLLTVAMAALLLAGCGSKSKEITVQPVQFTKNGTGTKQKEPYSSSTAPVYSW